eukprot:11370-Heterococcus_DN1.PRE.12
MKYDNVLKANFLRAGYCTVLEQSLRVPEIILVVARSACTKSCGLTDNTQPSRAACVADTFERLCALRLAQTLPACSTLRRNKHTFAIVTKHLRSVHLSS